VARAAGAEVTVLQRGERILKNSEAEIVDRLTDSARTLGIQIVTNFQACGVERRDGAFLVSGNTGCGTEFEGDLVVHGAGRVADMDAATAAENILHANRQRADYENVPHIVFTLPPLSGVGMTEAQAKKSGARFHINRGTMTGWASARRIGQKHAFYKVLIEDETGHILGAHLFGHNAGEAINIFAMAMKFGISNLDLKKVLWAYPTHVSDLKYMIE